MFWSPELTLATVTNSYLETAVWSSNDWDDMRNGNPAPLDENHTWHDFTSEAYAAAEADCKRFLELLEAANCMPDPDGRVWSLYEFAEDIQCDSRIGHDFWLTRNGHGAGFWDGDYGDYGDFICEVMEDEFGKYAELNICVNPDGKLEFE